jgi:pyruvate dehydrogenase E2 component (dihydrolipoamide acetyltransferase)
MAQIVRMPAVMANATDAVLSQWLAAPGTKITVGDPLAEIETDKAVVEYAAEIEGTIGRFLVEPGTRVAVGDPIVMVLEDGEDASAISVDDAGTAGSASADDHTTEPAAPQSPGPDPQRAHQAGPEPMPGARFKGRLFATPIARRIAAQRGIDLAGLNGTGPNGRIVRRDVEAYDAASDMKARSRDMRAGGGYTDVPLTRMRRAIAERLTESKATVPHFYVTAHINVDRLLALRIEVMQSSPRKVSINDFVVKAVAAALVEVPAANAVWNGDSIRRFESVDIAVAVAVPDGLLTPVVRGVEHLRLVALSAEIAELAATARSGRLKQQQLEGGSFTVSSLGMHGVREFSAIINPPQSGLLAVGAAQQQPVVGADGQLSVGTVMTVTLSADHRVIDGALAADWVAALQAKLENPVSLLL